jgi:hypothetical protein
VRILGSDDPASESGSSKPDHAGELLGLLQFSLDHASDAVYWTDSDGRLILATHAKSSWR